MRAYLKATIAMTAAGLGLLLSFTGPVAAIPLESGTARFERSLGGLRSASGRFEGPDGFLSFQVRDEPLRGGVSSNCFFVDCGPDQVIEAFAVGEISDALGAVFVGTQTNLGESGPACGAGGPPCVIVSCGASGIPGFGPFCNSLRVAMHWEAFLPPFGGELETTVPGTFEATIFVGIFSPFPFGPPPPPGFSFSGTGTALFHVTWNQDTEGWRFQSVDGRIEPAPEPATLLLFGTTAAGLGLARWYRRRRRGHEHEAPNVRISRRYRLMLGMFVFSLALMGVNPSGTTAVPFEPLGSGSIHMTSLGLFTGGGTVTTLDNATISFSFGATSFGHVGPTGASANWHELGFSNVRIVTHAGEVFDRHCGTATPGRPCTDLGTLFAISMRATPPPIQPGDDLITVDGTYHLRLHASVFFAQDSSQQSFGYITENEGPASLMFARDSFLNTWRFRSGEAQVFTPEPTTLLLWGTSAAGLGLARWYRRRAKGPQHAA